MHQSSKIWSFRSRELLEEILTIAHNFVGTASSWTAWYNNVYSNAKAVPNHVDDDSGPLQKTKRVRKLSNSEPPHESGHRHIAEYFSIGENCRIIPIWNIVLWVIRPACIHTIYGFLTVVEAVRNFEKKRGRKVSTSWLPLESGHRHNTEYFSIGENCRWTSYLKHCPLSHKTRTNSYDIRFLNSCGSCSIFQENFSCRCGLNPVCTLIWHRLTTLKKEHDESLWPIASCTLLNGWLNNPTINLVRGVKVDFLVYPCPPIERKISLFCNLQEGYTTAVRATREQSSQLVRRERIIRDWKEEIPSFWCSICVLMELEGRMHKFQKGIACDSTRETTKNGKRSYFAPPIPKNALQQSNGEERSTLPPSTFFYLSTERLQLCVILSKALVERNLTTLSYS